MRKHPQRRYASEAKILKRIDKLQAKAARENAEAFRLEERAAILARNPEAQTNEEPSASVMREDAGRLRNRAFHTTNTGLKRLGDALSRLRTPLLPICADMDPSVTP